MHYGQIMLADSANGEGIRVSLFVSGCTNCCKGCFQPETWDFLFGQEYNEKIEEKILQECSKDYYAGLTLLGGEPFEIENQRGIISLIRKFKERFPHKNIWVYTGFTYDKDLIPGGKRYCEVTDEILDSIDILVDGKFILEQKNISLKFRGSENQRIIDMKQTRKEGHVVLSPLNN